MKQKGFTLIEMVVVLAVVAILAAILIPTIAKNIQDANITRAQNETQVIAAAMASFYKDLGRWPQSGWLLYTQEGEFPPDPSGSWEISPTPPEMYFENHLIVNDPNGNGTPNDPNDYPTTGKFRWRGPYLADITSDPWGYKYMSDVSYPFWWPGEYHVKVVSAGPDKEITTEPGTLILGDDIGTLLGTITISR